MKEIVLLLCLWIPILAFSQDGYPKKIVLGRDTVVAITESQLIKINQRELDYEQCVIINQNKDSIIHNDSVQIVKLTENYASCNERAELCDSIVVEERYQKEILRDELEIERKNVKKLKITRKIYSFVGTSLGIVGGWFVRGALTK